MWNEAPEGGGANKGDSSVGVLAYLDDQVRRIGQHIQGKRALRRRVLWCHICVIWQPWWWWGHQKVEHRQTRETYFRSVSWEEKKKFGKKRMWEFWLNVILWNTRALSEMFGLEQKELRQQWSVPILDYVTEEEGVSQWESDQKEYLVMRSVCVKQTCWSTFALSVSHHRKPYSHQYHRHQRSRSSLTHHRRRHCRRFGTWSEVVWEIKAEINLELQNQGPDSIGKKFLKKILMKSLLKSYNKKFRKKKFVHVSFSNLTFVRIFMRIFFQLNRAPGPSGICSTELGCYMEKKFCKLFSESCTAVVLLPRQARRTLRKLFTKPFLQVSALPSTYHSTAAYTSWD